jgi:hypothetical protein
MPKAALPILDGARSAHRRKGLVLALLPGYS